MAESNVLENSVPKKKGLSILKKILLAIVLLIVVLVVVIAMQPDEFRIARSATMSAPPADVFAQVNDLHKWEAWSPWEKLDPDMKRTYEGSPEGTGAIYMWSGNSEVGEGRMTITDSRPSELVRFKLEFLKPFEATSTTEFTFKPDGDKTEVTWTMFGQRSFMEKGVCLFMSMDKMLGGEFEKGLAQMKSVAEAKP